MSFIAIFADNPVPDGCRYQIWRRLEAEAFRIHDVTSQLPVDGRASVPQLHALATSTGRCQRLLLSLNLREPLVRHAVTVLTDIVRLLERSVDHESAGAR